jgi:hypothetical protein
MQSMVFNVDGVLKVSNYNMTQDEKDVLVEMKRSIEESKQRKKWLIGVTWDATSASKPTSTTTPVLVDLDGDPIWVHLKGRNHFGCYYMLLDSEEEAVECYIKLLEWVIEKRTVVLEKQLANFLESRIDLISRHKKKVGVK